MAKNRHAVALGRRRAQKLSRAERVQSASHAASLRWASEITATEARRLWIEFVDFWGEFFSVQVTEEQGVQYLKLACAASTAREARGVLEVLIWRTNGLLNQATWSVRRKARELNERKKAHGGNTSPGDQVKGESRSRT